MLARLVCPLRTCWGYDTFDGMTEPDPLLDHKRDGERAIDRYHLKKNGGTKWDAVPFQDVCDAFEARGLGGVNWVVGKVEDTARHHCGQIAILRLDVDWYWPTRVALEQLYPRLVPGGFLIIDDYGHWMGCARAVDDYFGSKRPEFQQVDYSCVVLRK